MTLPSPASSIESLRPLAVRLRDAGPTTNRRRVVAHIALVAVAVAAAAGPFGLPGDLTATAMVAALFLHADAMQHEAVHRRVARSGTGNHLVGLLASVPMLVPYSLYEAFHVAHHAHTAQPADPEGRHEPALRWPWLVEAWRSLRFCAHQLATGVGSLRGNAPSYVRTERQRRMVRFDTVLTLAGGAALVAGAVAEPVIRWIWLVPFLAYVLVLFPVFHLYEHAGAETRIEAAGGAPVDVTSTLRLPRALSGALWHATLHSAHHAFPTVPWQHLPELQAHLDTRLAPELVIDGLGSYLRSPSRS